MFISGIGPFKNGHSYRYQKKRSYVLERRTCVCNALQYRDVMNKFYNLNKKRIDNFLQKKF